ncbi:MAG TPA: pseudouridine synthase [Pyrinomonadaceae bacterium]|jgi:23S rRNA pseudouridine2605 synthase|nr:pseudouridine synthase [Pyrinomonadaceae bacterium]
MEERLQKLIAAAGIASRRHAEELIEAGEVTVNGEVVREPGTKADPARDHIKVRGRLINPLLESQEKVYVLLNKPRGYLTALSDPEGRPLVSELVPQSLGRLHPVGRLDFNTEGLLILTNDGALTNYVTSARNHVEKVYEVKVKGVPPEQQIERLRRGVRLEDGARTAPARIVKAGETKTNAWYEVILREGQNQQIRRMFDLISHSVIKLRRVRIGPVTAEGILIGQWRHLTPAEVKRLKTAPPARKPGGKGGPGAHANKGGTGARPQGERDGAPRRGVKGGGRPARKGGAGRRSR